MMTNSNYAVKDINLAAEGQRKIAWAKQNMPVLNSIYEQFVVEKPFAGLKVALSIHLEAKTAYLCQVMAAAGAEMYVAGSNPLSTQDDIAAALAVDGIHVYAWYNCTMDEYKDNLRQICQIGPDLIIDDGGDIVNMLHEEFPELCDKIIGGCEETTTGVIRLKGMAQENKLRFPMILVNDAQCKYLFDNRYGTGQSVWDGINRTTNLVVAGKTVVVCGYGWCGKGVALRAKGLGAKVIVTEIDPIKAIEAIMDGFTVMPINEAAAIGDFFITVTGCNNVIAEADFKQMQDGAILANAGHFDVEIDMATLAKVAVSQKELRHNIMGYTLDNGNTIAVIAEGRLVNLAAGDGHPAEIMDMSFSLQALSAYHLVKHKPEQLIVQVPREIDLEVAGRKLNFMGYKIDTLTKEQADYLAGWSTE